MNQLFILFANREELIMWLNYLSIRALSNLKKLFVSIATILKLMTLIFCFILEGGKIQNY